MSNDLLNSSEAKEVRGDSATNHFREDFFASIVVFLVALPLCIGIAVAVGVDPARALLTGIIGGIIVGFVAGSPLQVSGPAAGLFVIVADLIAQGRESYISKLGSGAETQEGEACAYALMVLGTSVFLAGILQVVAGKFKLGQWFRAVSPAVVKGMLAGIGLLILFSQFHVMLDHTAMWDGHKAHGGLQYLATIPEAIMKCFSSDTSANHHLAALTGILTIVCIVVWPMISPKKLKAVPAPLVGILVATLFATVAGLEIQKLQVSTDIFQETTLPNSPGWFQLLIDPIVLTGAVVIALVASAETLLCASAVDQLHTGQRTDYDKELTAQGYGNILCGLIGALPMTGVIVRSSANVNAGAKTKWSTIFHGFWLLIFVVLLPALLAYIPKAALGALLVHIGFKLVNWKQIKALWSISRAETGIYFATMITIVCSDLLIGVVFGIVLSGIKLLYRFTYLELDLEKEGDVSHLQLLGSATFLRLPSLAKALDNVERGSELHIHMDGLAYIDHACFDLITDWSKQHEKSGGKLCIDWDELQTRFLSDPSLEVRAVLEKKSLSQSTEPKDSSTPHSLSS